MIHSLRFSRSSVVLAVSLGTCVFVFLRNFWISDDGYIIFRVVENFLNGYGLRWNIAERVQPYVCPLWVGLLIPFTAVAADPYPASLFLSLFTWVSTLLILFAAGRFRPVWILSATLIAVSSRSFVDYSSSGLENPLTMLIASAGTLLFLRSPDVPRPALALFSLGGLLFLARIDAVLLLAGPMIGSLWLHVRRKRVDEIALGLTGLVPALLWALFAAVYFGSPIPNVFFAKLGSLETIGALIKGGRLYIWATAQYDPLGAAIIASGISAGLLILRTSGSVLVSLSILLYLFYVIWIGGDFMLGRFFAAPIAVSLVVIGITISRWKYGAAFGSSVAALYALLFFTFSPHAPLRITSSYQNRWMTDRGYADEKGHYFPESGLHRFLRRTADFPDSSWTRAGRRLRDSNATIAVGRNMGFLGYHAGPRVHIVDEHSLTDPFLSRLRGFKERPGHVARFVPEEYLSGLAAGRIIFQNAELQRLSNDIVLATRAPLFSQERMGAVARLFIDQRPIDVIYRLRPEDYRKFRTEAWWPPRVRTMTDDELSVYVLSGEIFRGEKPAR